MKKTILKHVLRMTKLFSIAFLFQCLTMSLLLAWSGNAQVKSIEDVTVSLSLQDVKIESVFLELERSTGFNFVFTNKELRDVPSVGVSSDNNSLYNVLLSLAKQTNLTFKQVDYNIHVKRSNNTAAALIEAQAADITVKGKVTDESGDPLPGASVAVLGTNTGTVTDLDGNYSITVPDGGTLVFSYIGFESMRVAVDNRAQIDVTLKPDISSLGEVVVIGYGTQQKRDVTGSIASVNSESLKNLPVASVTEALAGQLAGVQIQQTTGAPGAGLTVRVRGTGSISAGNEPLYVVDGFPLGVTSNISMINPNDIESIDVLKDASAAAIYGSRGANGVVIITTKRGKTGKPTVNLDVFSGIQEVTKKIDVLNAEQFADFGRDAFNNAWIDAGGNASDPNSIRPNNERLRVPDNFTDPSLRTNTDWQDEIFSRAAMQNYQLTVSGGTENVRYLVSGNYFNQDGIIRNSNFERFSLRANIDADVTSKLKIGMNVAPSISYEKRPPTDGHWASDGAINAALAIIPTFPVRDANGTYNGMAAAGYGITGFGLPGIANPVAFIEEIQNDFTNLRLLSNFYADYEIKEGLVFRTTFGADLNTMRNSYFRPSIVPANQQPPPTIPVGASRSNQDVNWISETTLTYKKLLAEKHSFDVLVGYSVQKAVFESNAINAANFPNDLVPTVNAGLITGGSSLVSEWALMSYLGRINYDYDEKYLVTATVRRDGSSRFGQGNKWGVFPSASLGWRLSKEAFIENLDMFSDMKMRVSYGLTGNNEIPNYGAIGLLGQSNYVFGSGTGSVVNGLAPTSISNIGLSWETTRQFNAGFDFSFLNNRLNFIIDHYISNTSDLLLNVPVPRTVGFGTALQNIGEVQNIGWEFTAITDVISKRDFKWTTNMNIAFNRNEVLALGPLGDPIRSGAGIGETHITVIGEPIGNFFGYIQDGVFQNEEELLASPRFPTSRPGDVKYRDVDGDGQITPNDRTIIGNNQPDFIWGFTNQINFKNFDFNFIFQGVQGGQILNLSQRFLGNLEGNQNQTTAVLNRWRSPEDPGDGITPRANSRTTGNNNQVSSRWVEDGSFIRLRNITLGYNLPQNVATKIFVSNARVYLGIQNAFTLTNYTGYNPEVNLGGAQSAMVVDPGILGGLQALTPGTDYGGFPLARTYTLGVNLSF